MQAQIALHAPEPENTAHLQLAFLLHVRQTPLAQEQLWLTQRKMYALMELTQSVEFAQHVQQVNSALVEFKRPSSVLQAAAIQTLEGRTDSQTARNVLLAQLAPFSV